MLKRFSPPNYNHLFLSDSETESDDDDYHYWKNNKKEFKRSSKKETTDLVNGENIEEAFKEEPEIVLIQKAKKYQECMKQLPVPVILESSSIVLPFITWRDLAKSMKHKYEQPLHYLTHNLLKQWDESRANANNEINPIGNVIHPAKAEATVWVVEEYNRQFASHYYIAKLWISDPNYHSFVDAAGIPKF